MNNFWEGKHIFVTGAAGFIGSHVVNLFATKGARVTAIVSPHVEEKVLIKRFSNNISSIQIKHIDLLHASHVASLLTQESYIFHFAALDGGWKYKMEHPAEIFTKNVTMTLNLLNAAKQKDVKFFYMSSIDVYPKDAYGEIDESVLQKTILPSTAGYAWAKRTNEVATQLFSCQYGIDAAIVRAGNIYGPGDYARREKARVIPTFIMNALRNEDITIQGSGQSLKSFLYIDDFVQAAEKIMKYYPGNEPVNIVSEEYITLENLAKMIIRKTKSKSRIICSEKKTGETKNSMYVVKKIKRLIDFSETFSLEKGLDETITYFAAYEKKH